MERESSPGQRRSFTRENSARIKSRGSESTSGQTEAAIKEIGATFRWTARESLPGQIRADILAATELAKNTAKEFLLTRKTDDSMDFGSTERRSPLRTP